MRAPLIVTSVALAALLALAGCTGSSGGASSRSASSRSASSSSAPTSTPTTSRGTQYYVSIGDSYAAGYQGIARGRGVTTTNGFAYQVVTKATTKGYHLTLVNFGCGGATTQSMLTSAGCVSKQLGPGSSAYSTTQTAAAVAFLKAHRGHIGLITVSIGGNDVIPCGIRTDAISCLSTSLTRARTNLNSILAQLRAASGAGTRIVGTTYPDVLLGNLVSTDTTLRSLASLSVTAFKSLINPQLQQAYQAVGGRFVDVTSAFGSYGSLSQTTTLAPYGTIPVPVAKICTLTYYCAFQDIHPRTAGYAIIADLVVGTLPRQ